MIIGLDCLEQITECLGNYKFNSKFYDKLFFLIIMKHLWHMTLTIRPNQQHNHTPNPHATIGDCPDAAYFGPNVHADRDEVEMLTLKDDSGEGGEGRGERGGEGCEGWLGGEGERERGGYEGILCYNFTFKLYQIPSNVGITLILNHTSTLTLALTPTQSPNPQPSTIALTPTQNPNPQPSNPKPQTPTLNPPSRAPYGHNGEPSRVEDRHLRQYRDTKAISGGCRHPQQDSHGWWVRDKTDYMP